MKLGFIGTGTMGSMLMRAFLASGRVRPQEIYASNRTREKANPLAQEFKGLTLTSNIQVASRAEEIFLCVKPKDFPALLEEIGPVLKTDQRIFSIASAIELAWLEQLLPGQVVKVIPSINQTALGGNILVMYGSRSSPKDREQVEELWRSIGSPVVIDESQVRTCSDLTSCGPAFLSQLIRLLAQEADRVGGIGLPLGEKLLKNTLIGLGHLVEDYGLTFDEVIRRVAVPGGVTAEGLKILAQGLPTTYAQLFRMTLEKQAEDRETLKKLFAASE